MNRFPFELAPDDASDAFDEREPITDLLSAIRSVIREPTAAVLLSALRVHPKIYRNPGSLRTSDSSFGCTR